VHLLLTDGLTCPRCGPEFGLILLAARIEDRRVLEGALGCPNCRDSFPVKAGFGDLRAPPRGALGGGRAGPPEPATSTEPDAALRMAALLGVAEGPGTLVLVGSVARWAGALATRITGVEVVAVDADLALWPETERVSRMVARPGLPFFARSVRGAVVDGALGAHWIREAARVVAPLGRVVVTDAPADGSEVLRESGFGVLVAESGTVVAARV
jgi:uncharacterized protein YbaR (Trm112 family)